MDLKSFELSNFLPYKLAVLSERISQRLAMEYGKTHGLSVAEWRVLVHLSHRDDVSIREIHNCVNLEKPRVSRAVSKLEATGLVEKTMSHTDNRLVVITLTDAGKTTLREIIPEALHLEGLLVQTLSMSERQQFYDIMEKLHRVLDDDPKAKRRMDEDLMVKK